MVSDEVVVFDNLSGRMYLIVHADIERGDTLEGDRRRASEPDRAHAAGCPAPSRAHSPRQVDEADFVSGFTESGFKQAVERIKQYILDGDCMQVVMSQRLSIPFAARPLDLYRALRGLNPSPYMYFLDLGDFQIVGSSPEILVRLEDGEVTVRPIAGTRRRGHTEEEDLALEARAAGRPQGTGRAPDADRPGAQRRRPGGRDRHGQGHRPDAWSSATPMSCTSSPTWWAS